MLPLFDDDIATTPPRTLSPCQAEVIEALRWLVAAGDTADIQRALAEHDIPRERNSIAKRLCELEDFGLVERVGTRSAGRGVTRTLWRRR